MVRNTAAVGTQGVKEVKAKISKSVVSKSDSKIEFYGSEISADKISPPPHRDERKHSFLVHSAEKRLSLVPNILLL